jgi:hypothetical protein
MVKLLSVYRLLLSVTNLKVENLVIKLYIISVICTVQ